MEKYSLFLAKRLLLNKSQSEDMEKSALALMKMHYGPQFTERAERMIGDLAVSREHELVRRPHRAVRAPPVPTTHMPALVHDPVHECACVCEHADAR